MYKKIYLKYPARLILTFFFAILMSACLMLVFQDTANGNSIPEYATIIVNKGDTLWNIARQYNYDDKDIRSKIDEIKELNGISSNIKIGQELKIRIN